MNWVFSGASCGFALLALALHGGHKWSPGPSWRRELSLALMLVLLVGPVVAALWSALA